MNRQYYSSLNEQLNSFREQSNLNDQNIQNQLQMNKIVQQGIRNQLAQADIYNQLLQYQTQLTTQNQMQLPPSIGATNVSDGSNQTNAVVSEILNEIISKVSSNSSKELKDVKMEPRRTSIDLGKFLFDSKEDLSKLSKANAQAIADKFGITLKATNLPKMKRELNKFKQEYANTNIHSL